MDTDLLFRGLHHSISHPVVEGVDCGEKCSAEREDGLPACCVNEECSPTAVPLEVKYLMKLQDKDGEPQWEKQLDRDGRVVTSPGKLEVYLNCTGPKKCKRESRSLVCRWFPFNPYFTALGDFVGLVADYSYKDTCWVVRNIKRVNLAFVNGFELSWRRMIDINPVVEAVWAISISQQTRGYYRALDQKVPVVLFERYADLARKHLIELPDESPICVFPAF